MDLINDKPTVTGTMGYPNNEVIDVLIRRDAHLALTLCPALEKLRSDVALMMGTQRHFRATSAVRKSVRCLGPISESASFLAGSLEWYNTLRL